MAPEGSQSSEIERLVQAIERFRPSQSLRIFVDYDLPSFLRLWALARLLAWVVLDQRAGQRGRGRTIDNPATRGRQTIRTKSAQQAGRLLIGFLLDRRFQRDEVKQDDEMLYLMLWLFMKSGGFGMFVRGRGARALLSDAKKANRELGYVYRIVLFLCRYKKHISEEVKFDIETAKQFVAKNMHEGDSTYGLSKISKIWEKYKQAAPYVFAFYGYCALALKRTTSPGQVVDFLEKLASSQPRLNKIMGRAAYAADILDQRARGVRLSDFRQIPRVEPPLSPFQSVELAIINSIDRQAAIR
jgi:hypothetical protein